MARYDITSTTLGTLLEDPEVVAIMEKHAPGITSNPMTINSNRSNRSPLEKMMVITVMIPPEMTKNSTILNLSISRCRLMPSAWRLGCKRGAVG